MLLVGDDAPWPRGHCVQQVVIAESHFVDALHACTGANIVVVVVFSFKHRSD